MNIKALLGILTAFIIISKEYLLFNDTLVIIAVFATVFYLIISNFSTPVTSHIADVCTQLNNEYTSIFRRDETSVKSLAEELRQYLNCTSSTDIYVMQLSDKIIFA